MGGMSPGRPLPQSWVEAAPPSLVSTVLWQTHLTRVGCTQERQWSALQAPVVPAMSGRYSSCSLDGWHVSSEPLAPQPVGGEEHWPGTMEMPLGALFHIRISCVKSVGKLRTSAVLT